MGSPDSDLLNIWDKSADPGFGVRGSVDGLLCFSFLLLFRGGTDSMRARCRRSAEHKQAITKLPIVV